MRSVPCRAARSSARSCTWNSSGRVRLSRRPRSPCRLPRVLVGDPAARQRRMRPMRRELILVDVEGADGDRPRRHPFEHAAIDRRTARPRRDVAGAAGQQELRAVQPDALGAGVARGGEIVGELDVRVEPDAHAVGGRRRPPALGVAPRGRAGDRRRWRATRASVSSSGSTMTSLAVAVDDDQLPGLDRRGSRRAGRRPPARRASARGSRCDRCGCRRRSRSRGPSSSRPAPRATASARRR